MYGVRGAARLKPASVRRMSVAPALENPAFQKTQASAQTAHSKTKTNTKTHSNINTTNKYTLASDDFLGSLSSIHTASVHVRKATQAEKVKKEIANLLKDNRYDTLLSTLVHWTSPKSELRWSDVLQQREMTHILSKIVRHQIGAIHRATSTKAIAPSGVAAQHELARAHQLREKLRTVYSNLLGSDHQHLYAKGHLTNHVTKGYSESQSFSLSAGDYENLITLELNNGKLDLASRWFQHLEAQHPGTHHEVMTHRLWLLKFEVYGGAKASLWRVEPSDLYEKEINPRQSRLKSERPWMEVFNEYVQHQPKSSGSAQCVFDKSLVQVMFYSIAYSRNVAQLAKLVEQNWGITSEGKLVAGFQKPSPSAPLYPDVDVLMAIVVSMVFNKQFVASMAYMNAFQQHYHIDLSTSSYFWDQLFRWSEISTRFSEFRALQHYIRETDSGVLQAPAEASELSISLEEAKKSADFDYEGYLAFVGELTTQRSALISELWRCFHDSSSGFSARPFQTYLALIKENPSDTLCYEYLGLLSQQAHMHQVPKESYNYRATRDRLRVIRDLYADGMKVLVNLKGEAGEFAAIETIIDRWSMDEHMNTRMTNWVAQQQDRYYELQHEREMTTQEEEEDKFLGLM